MSDSMSEKELAVLANDVYSYVKTNAEKLKHEYEITVSEDYIKQKVALRLREIAHTIKSPGFRPGKVPYSLVSMHYQGEALQHVIDNAIDYCSSDLINNIGVESHIYPKIDIILLPDLKAKNKNGNFVYRLSFEEMPKVPIVDLDKISLKEFKATVGQDDVKEFIDSLSTQFPKFASSGDLQYQAQKGDQIAIDFEGRIEGKLFRGGNSKGFSCKLGSSSFIYGFEEQLIGMKVGETKSFKLKFPNDYKVSSLAGQEAEFSVRMNEIRVVKDFDNDDEIAKNVGFKDYSSLMDHAHKVINDQSNSMAEFLMKAELFDYLNDNYNFDLPVYIVEQEQQRVKQELGNRKNSEKEAQKRVKLAMLFMKLGSEYKIMVTQDDIINVIANEYVNQNAQFDQVLKRFKSNRQFQELVRGQALEYKVVNYIIEKANKEPEVISMKELKELFDNI